MVLQHQHLIESLSSPSPATSSGGGCPVSRRLCLSQSQNSQQQQPNNWTVLCGRDCEDESSTTYNHVGNRRLTVLCMIHLAKYKTAINHTEKMSVIVIIINAIREASGCEGFVEKVPFKDEWLSVSYDVARQTVEEEFRKILYRQKVGKN